jgi:hypothetical protein
VHVSKAHSSEGRFPDLSAELAFFDVSVPLLSNFNTLIKLSFYACDQLDLVILSVYYLSIAFRQV